MEDDINITIFKYYFFNHNDSNLSRFHNFFKLLKKYEIDIDKISSGKDKRTTIIIKNLQHTLFNKNLLKEIINKFGNINFIYMVKEENLSKYYVNVVNYRSIINIINGMKNFINNLDMTIYYSPIQGKKDLLNNFIDNKNNK